MLTLPNGIAIRPLDPATEIGTVTDLLHRAYRELADMGLRYLATHQDEQTTEARIAGGECFVACAPDGAIVGTITFRPAEVTGGCDWYDRPDVASLQQLGVDPAWRGRGLGRVLADLAEQRAAQTGAVEIALDTAEPAKHLIAMYMRWGYRPVALTRWQSVNYQSVVLSKRVSTPGGEGNPPKIFRE